MTIYLHFHKCLENFLDSGFHVLFVIIFQSTGDSLDETDNRDAGGGGAGIGGSASGGGMSSATHRCTTYNEVIDADNPQTPEDVSTIEF